ncbi:MAG: lysine--tRNA ligase [Rickettsiales bacterium]|jgi:lysyl-tRNA synthetase class 1|nr:lysine--tRNA ligase [Rickettsiales bacterium]
MAGNTSFHWADQIADKIISEKGDRDSYTLAAGITPSGTIHFGKFREVMTVDLVARALMRRGKKVRFIYSWDDYDTFRKVPADMPRQEMLKEKLYQPIVDIPDPYGTAASYARHNELSLEDSAPKVGIDYVEYIYQNEKYRAGDYNALVTKAMDARDEIAAILQEFKTNDIPPSWMPVETYCSKCNRDRVAFSSYDGAKKTVEYECKLCGHRETIDLNTSRRLKLPWRVDWPMRWAYEGVDFEPGGRDHSSAGGSRDTGAIIARRIFGAEPPVYCLYESIRVKGQTKKMSSSSGNGFSLESVLAVYEPEIVRWFFASYKPDAMFDMAFDLDVIKNYEEFDQTERAAYGLDETTPERRENARRIYELSQLDAGGKIPDEMPFQPSFRHLCNILQINDFDIAKTRAHYAGEIKSERDERRFAERAERAAFWIKNHAPEDFKFALNRERRSDVELTEAEAAFITDLKSEIKEHLEHFATDRDLQNLIAGMMARHGLTPEAYKKLYQLLISRDRGPKIAGFIRGIGSEKILKLL